MAITKIGTMSDPPGTEDWTTLMSHVQGFVNQVNGDKFMLSQDDTETEPVINEGTYITMGGTMYLVDTEDYAISGTITSSATNYIYLTSDGDTLTATWTTDISSYSWNSIYGYMSDGTNMLLSYSVYYDGTTYTMGRYLAKPYNYLTVNKDLTVGNILIKGSSDVSPSSTDSPFQIGADDSQNMAFDTNQILVRDGVGGYAPEGLALNYDGGTGTYGDVYIGNIIGKGSVSASDGRLLKNSYISSSSETITKNDFYDLLSSSLSSVDDILALHGAGLSSEYTYTYTFAKRTTSNTIVLYCIRNLMSGVSSSSSTVVAITLTNGNTDTILTNLYLTW